MNATPDELTDETTKLWYAIWPDDRWTPRWLMIEA
jgi:hypothetical protein